MANVKEIVSKMLAQGMSPEEVKSNLDQLGFANAEQIIKEVKNKGNDPQANQSSEMPSGFSMTSIDDSGEEKELNMLNKQNSGAPTEVTTNSYDSVKIAKQLDDTISLMKSIEKLNKQILKANQEILTKLSEK